MFWQIYNNIATILIVSQLVFLVQSLRNFRYVVKKSRRKPPLLRQPTLLTVPCKGIDSAFDRNISSFFKLDYDNFHLHFVVEDKSDPAYEKLCALKDKLAGVSNAIDIKILIAGPAAHSSQKIHNLLYSCDRAPENVEIFAFADSDACIGPDWLSHLVYPLRKQRCGAATGYRWFIPQKNNLASLALSAINAKVAQLLGNTRFNQAWGGSMAIRAQTFHDIKLDTIWKTAISDDLSLSYAVKKAGMKIIFIPACLVASYEQTTWPKLFEFTRRQFVITKVTMPGTWSFALFSSTYSLAGLWATAAIAIIAAMNGRSNLAYYTAVPAIFFIGQITRSILRQTMIAKLHPRDAEKMKPAAIADILGTCFWSWPLFICIVASAFGRTITWRGIKYKLISPTETIIKTK